MAGNRPGKALAEIVIYVDLRE
ncbi:uncharacterized protein G2W53_020054 [Senna tora]|uniref:Uncharacterized protein n=1 Tax=Senna tora TaxID=362788 RepID=A0A834WMI8_9FABA|nr:uncharacterized protein G2W53_020054 [Senna tora]